MGQAQSIQAICFFLCWRCSIVHSKTGTSINHSFAVFYFYAWGEVITKTCWRLAELAQYFESQGSGSLEARFEVDSLCPISTIVTQFNSTTLSGLEFELASSGYRVPLIKNVSLLVNMYVIYTRYKKLYPTFHCVIRFFIICFHLYFYFI